MRSLTLNMFLPLTLLAATAVPTDPARAEGIPCPHAATVQKESKPAVVETKKAPRPKLEAL